jgi:hypothetical protein
MTRPRLCASWSAPQIASAPDIDTSMNVGGAQRVR